MRSIGERPSAGEQAPLAVSVGSMLALWSVAAIAVIGGQRLLRFINVKTLRIVTAVVLVADSPDSPGGKRFAGHREFRKRVASSARQGNPLLALVVRRLAEYRCRPGCG
jgi:hypothetical protein